MNDPPGAAGATPVASPWISFRGRVYRRAAGFVAGGQLSCCLGHVHAAWIGRDGKLRCYHRLDAADPRSPRCGALLFVLVFPSAGDAAGPLLWAADVDEHDLRIIERGQLSVSQILNYFGAGFARAAT